MPKRRPSKESASDRLKRIEDKRRREWRQEFVDKYRRQVMRENRAIRKFNREHKSEIEARKIKPRQEIRDIDPSRAARLEAVQFAPRSRLLRYAIDLKRPLTKDERSREFNTRYIDRLTGWFVSKEYAMNLMDEMRAERQTVSIMLAKNCSWKEAHKWREHLLDTKNLGYIIRIYGS